MLDSGITTPTWELFDAEDLLLGRFLYLLRVQIKIWVG